MGNKQKWKLHEGRDTVSDPEWWLALEVTAKWIAKKLAGYMNGGAFDESVFGMPAPEHFANQAFEKLYTGEWEWCSYRAVHTQMIRIALSDMHHHLETWNEADTPETVEIDERLADRLAEDMDFMDLMYDKAYEYAGKDEDLVEYVEAVRKYNNYEVIAEELHIEKKKVYQRQRKLFRRIELRKIS